MSSTMRGLVKFGQGCLPQTATDTADFLLFIDKLFDSCNASTISFQEFKTLRCAVTEQSAHLNFWNEAIDVLRSIHFETIKGRQFVPPSVKNWISTLRGFMYLWKKLNGLGFKYLCTRNLNQDPLENFFGCVRSHGFRNINPTCTSFMNSYKSLLINNFMAVHSPGANCEKDDCDGALDTLRHFIEGDGVSTNDFEVLSIEEEEVSFNFTVFSNIIIKSHSYVAGYIARCILKNIHQCAICRYQLISLHDVDQEHHQLINERAYSSKALLRPNTTFTKLFGQCNDVVHFYLPELCAQNDISKKLIEKIYIHIKVSLTCKDHNLFSLFVNKFVQIYILMWTRNINDILKGRNMKNINDAIKQIAVAKYKKNREKKRKLCEVKQLPQL